MPLLQGLSFDSEQEPARRRVNRYALLGDMQRRQEESVVGLAKG
ncbi:MAG: hypothetical protein QG572_550, partial [Pseudomonadota bacterium]|nr:hypothetical protein [Pseudomonadota bacterium]